MRAYIGTSGWDYQHWKGVFYPGDCPRSRWLDYYSRIFPTVEVNATFYHRIRESTYRKWRDSTPEGFLWSVKASRYITHVRRLKEIEESLALFFSDVSCLGDKLGPILFQLPASLAFCDETASAFFRLLPGKRRYALEARHPSWTGEQALALLRSTASPGAYQIPRAGSPILRRLPPITSISGSTARGNSMPRSTPPGSWCRGRTGSGRGERTPMSISTTTSAGMPRRMLWPCVRS